MEEGASKFPHKNTIQGVCFSRISLFGQACHGFIGLSHVLCSVRYDAVLRYFVFGPNFELTGWLDSAVLFYPWSNGLAIMSSVFVFLTFKIKFQLGCVYCVLLV